MEGWKTQTLGDLFDITSSKRVYESEWKRVGVPFYRAREIVKLAAQGYVDNELFISEEMFDKYSSMYGVPKEGDIMVTGVGTLGICYVVKKNDRFYFKDGNIIWLKKKSDSTSRFVEYAFQSDYLRKQIDDTVGATVGTFTIIKAKNTQIPIPPLPEQQRIVAILDKAFGGIARAKANVEKNIQNARALFEGYLQSVFTQRGESKKGWQNKTIGEILKLEYGKPLDRTERKSDGCYPVYGANGEKDRTDKYYYNKPSVIVGRKGSAGEINFTEERFWPLDVTYFITFDSKQHNLHFLYYLLKTANLPKLAKGVKPGINRNEVYSQIVKVPPLFEQQLIVISIDTLAKETRHIEFLYQQKLAALDELKKSLLDQAFSGQL